MPNQPASSSAIPLDKLLSPVIRIRNSRLFRSFQRPPFWLRQLSQINRWHVHACLTLARRSRTVQSNHQTFLAYSSSTVKRAIRGIFLLHEYRGVAHQRSRRCSVSTGCPWCVKQRKSTKEIVFVSVFLYSLINPPYQSLAGACRSLERMV